MQRISPISDSDLLRAYNEAGDEAAFAELAGRHQHLVYAACCRRLGDAALAQDAAQMTFLLMAKKARALRQHVNLAGWLYQTALFQASNLARREKVRATASLPMELPALATAPSPEPETPDFGPHLDDALLELREADREAVVLRFFSGRSLRDVGAAQGTTEEAARKRIGRALERMADFLRGRGIAGGSVAALTAALTVPAQAAPAGFVEALANSLHSSQLVVAATSHAAWWLKVKIGTLAAAAIAVPLVAQWFTNDRLKRENERLRARDHMIAENVAAVSGGDFFQVEPRAGSFSIAQAPQPSRLLQLLDALFAAESAKRQSAKAEAWREQLQLSPQQFTVAQEALRSAGDAQRDALHALSSGDVQFDRVMTFLRAEQAARAEIESALDASQRAAFGGLVERDRQELARDLALWRLADLQLALRLSEAQKPAMLAILARSTLAAIVELPRADVADMETLLTRLDAIGAREHAEAGAVLTSAQHQQFQEQVHLRRRALDVLLESQAPAR